MKFEIKITAGNMYHFLMYHTYHGFNGIFSIVAGVLLLGLYAWSQPHGEANAWLYLLFGILFLVYQPWTLLNQAARQVKLNPVFQKPLCYEVSEEKIVIRQDGTENELAWTAVTRVRETSKCILVYTNKRNAFIWVKTQMGDQCDAVCSLIAAQVPQKLCKMKAEG